MKITVGLKKNKPISVWQLLKKNVIKMSEFGWKVKYVS